MLKIGQFKEEKIESRKKKIVVPFNSYSVIPEYAEIHAFIYIDSG